MLSVLYFLVHFDFVLIRLGSQVSVLHLDDDIFPVVVDRDCLWGRSDAKLRRLLVNKFDWRDVL